MLGVLTVYNLLIVNLNVYTSQQSPGPWWAVHLSKPITTRRISIIYLFYFIYWRFYSVFSIYKYISNDAEQYIFIYRGNKGRSVSSHCVTWLLHDDESDIPWPDNRQAVHVHVCIRVLSVRNGPLSPPPPYDDTGVPRPSHCCTCSANAREPCWEL